MCFTARIATCGPVGDFRGQALHFRWKAIDRKDVIDDAESKRSFGVDHVPGVEKLGRFRGTNQLGQEVGATIIREKTDLREILAEDSFFHGDADIRGKGQIHPRTRSGTVHGSNHRLRHRAHLQDRLHTRAQNRRKFRVISGGAAFANYRQVAARTKRAARTGQNHHMNGVVGGNSRQSVCSGPSRGRCSGH